MKERLDRLKKIEKLQKRLHELSQWRATALARERDQLAETHVQMMQSLGAGLTSFGGAAAAATRRIRRLEVEMTSAQADYEAQAKESLSHGARSKVAEKAVEKAAEQHRQAMEKKSLMELIEQSLQSSSTASRKP